MVKESRYKGFGFAEQPRQKAKEGTQVEEKGQKAQVRRKETQRAQENQSLEQARQVFEKLIEQLSEPEYFELDLYLLEKAQEIYKGIQEIYNNNSHRKKGQNNSINNILGCLKPLEATQHLAQNYFNLNTTSRKHLNVLMMLQIMISIQPALCSFKDLSVEKIMLINSSKNQVLWYKIAIGMIFLSAEVMRLDQIYSKTVKDYVKGIKQAMFIRYDFLKACGFYTNEMIQEIDALGFDTLGKPEYAIKLENSAIEILAAFNHLSEINKEVLEKKKGKLLSELPERLQELQKTIADIICEKNIQFPILEEIKRDKHRKISEALQEQIRLGINQFSLPKIQSLQAALLTEESSNGYWIDWVESLDEDLDQIKIEFLENATRNKLVSDLQNQMEIRMNVIASDTELSREFLDLVMDSLEDCFPPNGQNDREKFIEFIKSLNKNSVGSVVDNDLKIILDYVQNETGAPFLFEDTQGQKYLGRWFLYFRKSLIEVMEKNQTENSGPKNAIEFIKDHNNESNIKVRFEVPNNDKNDLLYSKNPKLRILTLRRLETIEKYGGLKNLINQVGKRGAVGFGCHELTKTRKTAWFKQGDIALDTGSAIRMILRERREENLVIITVVGLFNYHDLL